MQNALGRPKLSHQEKYFSATLNNQNKRKIAVMNKISKTYISFLKKFNTELSYNPATPLLGLYPGERKTAVHECVWRHHSQSPKGGDNPRTYPSLEEWVPQMWPVHTTQYSSAVKRNEALTHRTARPTLTLSCCLKRRQTQVTYSAWFHCYETSRTGK